MIPEGTVLLLGAGCSYPYGFPLGSALTDEIIGLAGSPEDVRRRLTGVPEASLEQFGASFARSGLDSVDAFLARQLDWSDVGKKVISTLILIDEARWKDSYAFGCVRKDAGDPYRYIWNRIAKQPLEGFSFKNLKVVSFNYDRSFECMLLARFQGTYDVDEVQAHEMLKTLEVVHVYGSLGSLDPQSSDFLPFGSPADPQTVGRASRSLRVIPEARDSDAEVLRARQILSGARRIAILGFGFDELNLERLQAQETLARMIPGDRTNARHFAVSCLGMKDSAVDRIARRCGHFVQAPRSTLPYGYHRANAAETLAEELILGEWQ
jgi:hypothetical protein